MATMQDSDDDAPLQEIGGEAFDPETGEVRDTAPTLEEVSEATTSRMMKSRPLTAEQIAEATKGRDPIPCGVLGWFAKIGETKGKGGKVVPGSRFKGQIVGTMTSHGRYGKQTSIVVFGRYQAPAHTKNGARVQATDKVGRWMIGIDATLTELPGHVGDILDLEMETRGGPGTPHPRHSYKRVDIWPIDSLQITPAA